MDAPPYNEKGGPGVINIEQPPPGGPKGKKPGKKSPKGKKPSSAGAGDEAAWAGEDDGKNGGFRGRGQGGDA